MNESNHQLTKPSHRLTHTLILIAIAVLGTWAISALPLIPSWAENKLSVMTGIDIVVPTIIGWRIITNRHHRRLLAIVMDIIFTCCAILMLWLILLTTSGGFLGGENFEATLRDNNSGDELFIYTLSEVPDGFIATRVAVRSTWLPIERTILHLDEPFKASKQTELGLMLSFGLDKYRYRYANGQLTPVTKQR